MTKRVQIVLFVLLGILFIQAAYSQDNQSNPGTEYWYKLSMKGQSAGYMHVISGRARYRDQDCYKSTTEMVFKTKNDGKIIELKTFIVSYQDLSFNPLYLKEEKQRGTQKSIKEIIVSDKEILFKETVNAKTIENRIRYEKGMLWWVDGLMLKEKGLLKVGTDCPFKIIAKERKGVGTENIKIFRKEKILVRGKEVDTFYMESVNSEFPGIIFKQNIDSNGDLVRNQFEGYVMVLTDEADAKSEGKIVDISSLIQTNVGIPFVHRITRMQVALTIDMEDKPEQLILDNEYQTIKKDGDHYDISIQSVPLDIKTAPILPIGNNNLKKYLKSNSYVQSEDPIIAAKAREIINGEQNNLEAVKKLSKWIYENIKSQKIKTINLSAKETLETKSGDCTENAALFCALARAGGVPTRIVHGLVFTGEGFGYHQWNEVYLNKWIPIDTTCNRIGIPAIYIKIEEDAMDQDTPPQYASLRLKMLGRTSIKILSFDDGANQRIDVSDENKYIINENHFFEDKRAGIKLIKPSRWKATTNPGWDYILISCAEKKEFLIIEFLDLERKTDALDLRLLTLELEEPVFKTKLGSYDAFEQKFLTKDYKNNEIRKNCFLMQRNGKTIFITLKTPKDIPRASQEELNAILQSIQF